MCGGGRGKGGGSTIEIELKLGGGWRAAGGRPTMAVVELVMSIALAAREKTKLMRALSLVESGSC